MVRLKEVDTYDDRVRQVFQFHYGTIKSFVDKSLCVCVRTFNSTMVRLKEDYSR